MTAIRALPCQESPWHPRATWSLVCCHSQSRSSMVSAQRKITMCELVDERYLVCVRPVSVDTRAASDFVRVGAMFQQQANALQPLNLARALALLQGLLRFRTIVFGTQQRCLKHGLRTERG